MTASTIETRDFRYRLYFRLMDICLFFAAVGLTEWLMDKLLNFPFFGLNDPYQTLLSIPVLAFNFFVPLFLIVAKPMRDEYAEILQRRTMVILGYIAAIFPISVIVLGWSTYLFLDHETFDAVRIFETEFRFVDFMARSWMIFMLLFVGVFQFLRWRDSR